MLNRRMFLKTGLKTSAAVIPVTAALNALGPGSMNSSEEVAEVAASGPAPPLVPLPSRMAPIDPATEPWQQKIRRVGQSNMTEHDPAVMNVEEWADYWHTAKADIVFVSVTGILAFYPSKVKFHRHGKYLHGRDFFGECVAAAKKRNMRVVARMSPDLNWGDALEAHPEWAMRNKDGAVQFNGEEPRLFKTCMFSTYMDDYVPAIMHEISSLYDVDCFYTNGWPPLGSLPECHCAICSKLPPSGTPAYWRVFDDRVFELWQKYDAIARRKSRTVSFLPTLVETFAAVPICIGWAESPHGFRPTTKGAPMTIPRYGDAVCKAASATPSWTASLPRTLLRRIQRERSRGATNRKIRPKRRCG